nr:alpha-N-acetyl-neuraminyl-2,3-beta-galactosyl-1,3-N-acetyl-galactosaminide alpha-2,6-sialyltransferase-like [Lytechinus pictus]
MPVMPDIFSRQSAWIIAVSVLVCCCIPFAFLDLGSSNDTATRLPHRVRLQRRYPTEKKVIGPNYIQHELPAMPIDLKARYEKRRLLGRYKLQARTSAIERFRRNVQPSPVDSKNYTPLMSSEETELDLQCGSCSLVANSGLMRRSSLGREIDQADCVFRMDDAPTMGYERDVGRRTTVRVISYSSLFDVAFQAENLLSLEPSATHLIFHGPEHVYSSHQFQKYLQHIKSSKPEVEMYHAGQGLEDKTDFELLKHTGKSRHTSSSEFSTHMYTLMAMKDMCSTITVYGMLPKNFCSENPGNEVESLYYKDPMLTACSLFSYHDNLEVGGQPHGAEQDVFRSWMESEEIRFVNPSWE